jgi:WD40 repeat protein
MTETLEENIDRTVAFHSNKTENSSAFERGTNYFLGIGINDYAVGKKLRNCVRDVTAIRDELTSRYDFEKENTFLITDKDATLRNILKGLDDLFKNAGENDCVVLMYSGHGENLADRNIGMIVPVDAKDEYDYLDLSIIKTRLDSFKCKHVFIVFDACFSGLIFTQRKGYGRTTNIPDNFPSRFALTSGRNSPVDDGKGAHSPFAGQILAQLQDNDDKLGSIALSQKILDAFAGQEDQLPDFGPISNNPDYRGQYYFYPKNYDESIERERAKRMKAEDARLTAEEARREAEKERKKAMQLALAAYAQDLAYKSKIALRDGDRTVALRLALFANLYVDANNPKVKEAFMSAFYHNDKPNQEPLPWNLQTVELTSSGIAEVKYSSDGKYVGIATNKNLAIIWDRTTDEMTKIFVPEKLNVSCLAFSPDGSRLALGYNTKLITLWDFHQRKEIGQFQGHENYISCVNFSPDGLRLVSGSADMTAKIWDVRNFECVHTITEHKDEVSVAEFSTDGKKLLTASFDKTAIIWDATGKQPLMPPLEGHSEKITSAAFSPDGSKIATASFDNTIIVWESETGVNQQVLKDHKDKIWSVVFSADGQYLASGSADKTAIVCMLGAGNKFVPTCHLNGHTGTVNSVAFSPANSNIVTGSFDKIIKIWDNNLVKEATKCSDSTGTIRSLAYLPNGKFLAAGYENNSIKIWNNETETLYKTLTWHGKGVNNLAIAPKGNMLVAVSSDTRISVWDTTTWELLKGYEAHSLSVRGLSFSPDGKKFATSAADKTIKIWDATSLEMMADINTDASIFSIDFFPDNNKLLCGDEKGNLLVIDTNTQKTIITTRIHDRLIRQVRIAPDGKTFASSSDDRTTKVGNAENGKVLFTLEGHTKPVMANDFSNDGTMLATASEDAIIKLWDSQTGKLFMTLEGHAESVLGVAFSPIGNHLASASKDGMIYIWNLNIAECQEQIVARHPISVINLSKLQLFELDQLLDQIPDNEEKLLATHETWQIAAFADLYALKVSQSSYPKQNEYEHALRLYETCLSHQVRNAYFREKIEELKEVWREKVKDGV